MPMKTNGVPCYMKIEKFYFSKEYDLRIVDRVGGGIFWSWFNLFMYEGDGGSKDC